MVRELPERVDDRVRSAARKGPLKKGRRFHPMMFEELLFHPTFSKTRQGPAAAWLLFISAIRDDLPWIYEVGIELYRAMRVGDPRAISEARSNLMEILEVTTHGPLMHEFMRLEDEEAFFMVRHIPEMMERFLDRSEPRLRGRVARTKVIVEPNTNEGNG